MTTVNSVNTYIVPTIANEVTMPSQPAFLAYLGAGDTDLNVTGQALTYQIGQGNALTEVFDQNADFNTNGTFTAPVTGRYFLVCSVLFIQAAGITSSSYIIVTSNNTHPNDKGSSVNAAGEGSMKVIALADMDAADTATTNGFVSDVGGDTVDAFGSANLYTYFAGSLVV